MECYKGKRNRFFLNFAFYFFTRFPGMQFFIAHSSRYSHILEPLRFPFNSAQNPKKVKKENRKKCRQAQARTLVINYPWPIVKKISIVWLLPLGTSPRSCSCIFNLNRGSSWPNCYHFIAGYYWNLPRINANRWDPGQSRALDKLCDRCHRNDNYYSSNKNYISHQRTYTEPSISDGNLG